MKYQHIILLITAALIVSSCKNEPEKSVTKSQNDVTITAETAEKASKCKYKVVESPEMPRKIRYDAFEDMLDIDDDILYIYHFWSTDCEECMEQMSCFQKIVQDMNIDKVQLVFVNMDAAKDMDKKVTPLIKERGFAAETLVLDVSKPEMIYNLIDEDWAGKLPATLFVDNSEETWLFYQKSYDYDELRAQIQPLATLKTL